IREVEERAIPEVDRKIMEANGKIDEIRRRSGVESLEEYMERVGLKQNLEKSAGESASVLRSQFGEIQGGLAVNVPYWEKEIARLEKYRDRAGGTRYSEETVAELEQERQGLLESLAETRDKVGSFQRRMEEIERKANEILRPGEEYLYCRTSVDLRGIRKRLEDFLARNSRIRNSALKAISIFEEIEGEEKEKISELFEPGGPVSGYFVRITGGLYREVTLNQRLGRIEVERADGVRLGAEKLSGGAYDQLYLSIRLALGERLLKGGKGFFLMDDPFIKADEERLRRQMEVLKSISASGWQVVYFSAKEEVRRVLADEIRRDSIDYVEAEAVFCWPGPGSGDIQGTGSYGNGRSG
ncbi:MAG: hypothetical protein JRH07_14550, partial [Deltaproteobacteria bacterium]|nr:hypothetical protein [Deltaproteobacteria bacterium]